MFWIEHSYEEYSTTYIGFSTLHRKSAFLHRIKISSYRALKKLPKTVLNGFKMFSKF